MQLICCIVAPRNLGNSDHAHIAATTLHTLWLLCFLPNKPKQLFCPVSRYANKIKKRNTMVKQNYHTDNSDLFTELTHIEHLKQKHNSSSLSVTIAKFTAKEGPEPKMEHTSRHVSNPTSTRAYMNVHYRYLHGWMDKKDRKQQVKKKVRITPA